MSHQLVEKCVKAFQPIQMASEAMSGEQYVTISQVVPLVHILMKTTAERAAQGCQVSDELNRQLAIHFAHFADPTHRFRWTAACYLDPRFKEHAFKQIANGRPSDACQQVVNRLKTELLTTMLWGNDRHTR